LFLVLAQISDIVRDGPSSDVSSPLAGIKLWLNPKKFWQASAEITKKSFSLARCQMAWWFFIIVAAYFWVWTVTGDFNSLTNGALSLMGISAATGLAAAVVDSSRNDQRTSLQNEQTTVKDRLAVL
jgi:hypothetical protein